MSRHQTETWGSYASASAQEMLLMNQMQFVRTHNSDHSGMAPGEMAVLRKQNPQAAESLAYKHPSIEAQLDAGVRQLELDVMATLMGAGREDAG